MELLDDDELFELMKQRNNILFAYIGMKVEIDGIAGIILGNQADDLLVQFNQTPEILSPCSLSEHSIKYYNTDGSVMGTAGLSNKL